MSHMSELSELYQQVILDHNKKPRNFRKLENANHTAEGYNPLCGDQLTIYLALENDLVKEVGFEGSGCAISKAAASMMTQAVKGKSKEQAEHLFQEFHSMVTGELNEETEENSLGNLKIFAGVRDFPVRVKCATLPGTPSTPHSTKKSKSQRSSNRISADFHRSENSLICVIRVHLWLNFVGQSQTETVADADSIEPKG